jgi:hypothetical protein
VEEGYFEHVENRPLGPMDVLPQHCFRDETREWLGWWGHAATRVQAAKIGWLPVGEQWKWLLERRDQSQETC